MCSLASGAGQVGETLQPSLLRSATRSRKSEHVCRRVSSSSLQPRRARRTHRKDASVNCSLRNPTFLSPQPCNLRVARLSATSFCRNHFSRRTRTRLSCRAFCAASPVSAASRRVRRYAWRSESLSRSYFMKDNVTQTHPSHTSLCRRRPDQRARP